MFTPSTAIQRVARQSRRPATRPGPEVISLASGDPDFDTPPHITRALIEAIEAGYTHYAAPQGDAELREAISANVGTRAGTSYSADQVVVTHGGSAALASAILATVDPGDPVLLPEPTYSLYADITQLAGGEPRFVRQTDDFHLDLEALRLAATGAKLLVLCHPANPTGVVYGREELQAVAQLAAEHDLLVLSDEAYDHIVFDGTEFVSTIQIDELRDRLIYCQTFSKTYAMTGWRVGYVVASKEIATAVALSHRTFNGPMNSAVQRAALTAITTDSAWPERMRQEYQARRELVLELFGGAPGVTVHSSQGTFYAFIKYDADVPSAEVAAQALERGVALRAGSEYGPSGEGHVRISFATSRAQLREGALRLRQLLASLES